MRWPWVSRKASETRIAAADAHSRLMADSVQRAADEVRGVQAALAIRTEEVGLLKTDMLILDSTEAVEGLCVRKIAGESWREYNRRVLQAFKEGGETTLFKATLDEIGRYERQAFVDCTGIKDPLALMRVMGGVEMARTLKMRLLSLTGSIDRLTDRERERQSRAQMAFSDTEDEILGREVLEGRIPKR